MRRTTQDCEAPARPFARGTIVASVGFVFDIQSMMIKDHESSAAGHAIMALAMQMARRILSPDVRARLKLCYLLPGEDGLLPFQGMQLSRHDAEKGLLTIEACVPSLIVHDPLKAGPYVLAVAADAIDAAQEFFLEQGITAFDAETLQAHIMTIKPFDLRLPEHQQVRNTDFDLS
jgi:hypothetical protein